MHGRFWFLALPLFFSPSLVNGSETIRGYCGKERAAWEKFEDDPNVPTVAMEYPKINKADVGKPWAEQKKIIKAMKAKQAPGEKGFSTIFGRTRNKCTQHLQWAYQGSCTVCRKASLEIEPITGQLTDPQKTSVLACHYFGCQTAKENPAYRPGKGAGNGGTTGGGGPSNRSGSGG
jgi:hypothetical protein